VAIARAPRAAGGVAESLARDHCASELRAAGFDVREEPFSYSAAPGRWGMPAAGAASAVVLACTALAGARGHAALALAMLVVAALVIAMLAPRALGDGVATLPLARRSATNLVATRGASLPRVWLVAHVDSKSQPVPMVARVAGVACSLGAWAIALVLAVAQLALARVSPLWIPIAVVGALAALPVMASVIGDASPGALDNASGVAAVLLAATSDLADAPPLPDQIGVLVTSAEELGLAGARLWGRSREGGRRVVEAHAPGRAVALNVDSVDDVGALRVMTASALPEALERALVADPDVRRGRLPPGILVDAIALADVGFAALTISKATASSLARIHTPRDEVARLRGRGVVEAARLVRRLAASASRA
jgi:hypothetical protein